MPKRSRRCNPDRAASDLSRNRRRERRTTRWQSPPKARTSPAFSTFRHPSELETGSDSIPVEHADGIKRELVEIFASEFEEFFQNVVRHGNDMTTAGRSLENVKHLANTRPEELGLRQSPHDLERLLHYRRWVDPGIGDSSSKD